MAGPQFTDTEKKAAVGILGALIVASLMLSKGGRTRIRGISRRARGYGARGWGRARSWGSRARGWGARTYSKARSWRRKGRR